MKRSFLLASVVAAAIGLSPAAMADSPRQFLREAMQGNNSEIMLGNLAAERARSPAVREFGRTLVSDHQQARGSVPLDPILVAQIGRVSCVRQLSFLAFAVFYVGKLEVGVIECAKRLGRSAHRRPAERHELFLARI